MRPPLLEVRQLVKTFAGVRALRGVSLTLGHGEVLAVIGENGAGKSTLMKILAGVQPFDAGELLVDGVPCVMRSVQDAMGHGIALIHQELNLAETLDVGANIFLGREPTRWGLIDSRRVTEGARRVLEQVGLRVDPATPLSELTIGQQQLVEIAKALSIQARVLIMDEPTSSLSVHEAEALLGLIRELRSKGVSVVYISHRLGEVEAVADRVEVLRDGENAGSLSGAGIVRSEMVRLMVGRELSQFYPHQPHGRGEVALRVQGLRTASNPRHVVGFEVGAGEIVGLAGLVGAGRTELLEAVFGVVPALAGEIEVGGVRVTPRSPAEGIAAGVALVPEDRKHHGLVLEMGVRENVSLASLNRDQRAGFLNRNRENELCSEMIGAMRIKTPNPDQPVQFLSGGNQQKVVIGKWLATRPRVLLLDEPTRGVDIGAKQEIYRLMEELAAQGVAILFASSEMEEILGMSDRVLVMHEGRLSGELAREALSEEAIMALATGSVASVQMSEAV
ncbi:MAG: Ribose import ATP-binding protein RbsA [Verrucomicrobiota bacterium]|jgi:ribose transport system ATP-binding protein